MLPTLNGAPWDRYDLLPRIKVMEVADESKVLYLPF